MLRIKNSIFILLLLSNLSGDGQLRLMCYNVLNFPTGNLQGRTDTLANIIDYARPHLLMLQELKTAQGLADITDMMNDIGYGDFAHSTFIPQQSPGSPGNLLQQAIVYDTEVLRMRSEGIVATNYRDINEFVLYLNDPQLAAGADTTFLYVYVTHLKSSTGAENEQLRLEMVNYLVDHFNTLPQDSNVIFSGDFNFYTNTEPAYQAIMNTENAIVMQDPFSNYGDWAVDNFAHREILTQSTRSAQLYNDGAGGGVDDRFDFILFSESMMNPDNGIHYSEGSFKSLGNTGLCYNENITDCDTGNPVPVDVLRSIYYMSDHIPQYCELETDILNSVGSRKNDEPFLRAYFYHPHQIQIEYSGFVQPVEILLHDMTGKIITGAMDYMTAGKYRLNSPEAGDGVYLISVKDNRNHYAAVKLCFIE